MTNFLLFIQTSFGYNEYQIALIRYTLTALLYDLSKLMLMGSIFYILGRFGEYAVACLLLFWLRTHSGGIHCKSYFSCLLVSFSTLAIAILVLPVAVPLQTLPVLIGLLAFMIITWYIAPISNNNRPVPDIALRQQCRFLSSLSIFLFLVITYIFRANRYILAGFWTIALQTVQLIISMFLKKGIDCYVKKENV